MRSLFVLLFLASVISGSTLAQDHIQLIGTFENCSDLRLMDIPDEEPAWCGFRNDSEMFYIFNKDYTVRDSFPIDSPYNFGNVRKMQIVRYMTPDSSDLHLVVHFQYFQENSVEMYSTEEQIFQYNTMNDFFWGKLHFGGSKLILYKPNGCIIHNQVGTIPQGTNGITQIKFISDEFGTSYFGIYNNHLVRLSSGLNILEEILTGGNNDVRYVNQITRFIYDKDEGLEILLTDYNSGFSGRIVQETGDVLFAFNGTFSFESMNGVNDILVVNKNLVSRRFRIPELSLCAEGTSASTRFQSGSNEEVLVEETYISIFQVDLDLFVPDETGYFNHYKTIHFPFEIADGGIPYLRHVSNHFFNTDDEYEFVYSTTINPNSELYVNLFIFNESGEILWSNESLNINMHFGECLIDNYFTTSARMVNVLDNSQQYRVIEEFDCRNLRNGLTGEIIIYPNPTNSEFRIAMIDPDKYFERIEIVDLEGRLVESFEFQEGNSNDIIINVDAWSAGVYMLRALSEENYLIERLVKY